MPRGSVLAGAAMLLTGTLLLMSALHPSENEGGKISLLQVGNHLMECILEVPLSGTGFPDICSAGAGSLGKCGATNCKWNLFCFEMQRSA